MRRIWPFLIRKRYLNSRAIWLTDWGQWREFRCAPWCKFV